MGSANTSVSFLLPDCPLGQGRKKAFPTHYRVPFVQLMVGGMSVESGFCLPCLGLYAGFLYCSRKCIY